MHNVYILNKMFDGSWNELEGNISHEVIDFSLTDTGQYYVYNVPYGTCPQWVSVGDDDSHKATHKAEYLLLTSDCRNNCFYVRYRIKLKRKLHNITCNGKWDDDEPRRWHMESLYREHGAYYGGELISRILDNHTPLFTFEAEGIDMAVDPIEISFARYNYQRNKGYVCDDRYPEDYQRLQKRLNEAKWVKVSLNPVGTSRKDAYSNKTFLNLILKDKSEECYTNILYSVLSQPNMLKFFCERFAPGMKMAEVPFTIKREHGLVSGRLDICAVSESQRIIIENKLFSGLNGIKQDSSSQLSVYYNWGLEAKLAPICFIAAPDYRVFMYHSNRLGEIEREIKRYDPEMSGKFILVSYGQIKSFIEDNRSCFSEDYEYYRYIDDIICAFDRYSYPSKSEYYQELFRQRIEDVKTYSGRERGLNAP